MQIEHEKILEYIDDFNTLNIEGAKSFITGDQDRFAGGAFFSKDAITPEKGLAMARKIINWNGMPFPRNVLGEFDYVKMMKHYAPVEVDLDDEIVDIYEYLKNALYEEAVPDWFLSLLNKDNVKGCLYLSRADRNNNYESLFESDEHFIYVSCN